MYRHKSKHGHGDEHVVKVGEDVLLDGDDAGEEVSEEDEDEAADEEGEDDEEARDNLAKKHLCKNHEKLEEYIAVGNNCSK